VRGGSDLKLSQLPVPLHVLHWVSPRPAQLLQSSVPLPLQKRHDTVFAITGTATANIITTTKKTDNAQDKCLFIFENLLQIFLMI
jgi:hypothetical protein